DTLLSRRFTIWTATVHMIKDQPLLGHGLGSHAALFFDYRRADIKRGVNTEPLAEVAVEAHNEYLQIAAETGLIGLLLFLMVVAIYVRTQWRGIARQPDPAASETAESKEQRTVAIGSLAVLAAVLINCLANFPFHIAATASFTVIILALSMRS